MKNPIYRITFLYEGLRYVNEVFAFDFDITYEGCLTMYFREGGRIVVDKELIEELEIEVINR